MTASGRRSEHFEVGSRGDRFGAHFAGLEGQYVLIGGTAATLAMAQAGLDFRATLT
jgi:hypothetical protein